MLPEAMFLEPTVAEFPPPWQHCCHRTAEEMPMLVKLYSREYHIPAPHFLYRGVARSTTCASGPRREGLPRVRQLSLDAGTLTPGELQIDCDRDPGAVYISVLVGLVRLNADHSPSFSPAVNSPYPSSKQDRVPKTAQVNYEASR